jgi:DNA-binding MarR family transcriptional regulator
MQIDSDEPDVVDGIRAQWRQELPEFDTAPMETIGRILRVQFLAENLIRQTLRVYGLDLRGFDVLATLRRSGPPYRLTPTRLYRELALTSGAITHLLDALERAGLIERASDPHDRRGTLAVLTRSGRSVVEEAMRAHMKLEAQLAAHLSKSERAQLAQLLKKILLRMEVANAGGK